MIHIKLKELKNPDRWVVKHYEDNYVCVRGYLYYNSKLYKGKDLVDLIQKINFNEMLSFVKEVNGFFAIIKKDCNKIVAIVDRIRSIPIFYGKNGRNYYISDDPYCILEEVGNNKIDKKAKKEFLATGYVTGPDTLYENIKQLQAGEMLYIDDENERIEIKSVRYYRFLKKDTFNEDFNHLLEKLDETINNVFSRLIEVLGGRPAVIPLSGGYDSRLIAIMLKKFKYDNVICFSYGKPGNTESQISQEVAKNLGFKWEFVPYSHEAWYNWYHSKEKEDYFKFADGLSSVAHIQDWPAVWELKRNKKLPENSVFIPGHTGDFIAGSHITNVYNSYGKITGEKNLIKAILDYHYSLYRWPKEDYQIFREKILSLLSDLPCSTFEELADAFEYWDWQERQAKFIVNSVRVYEFWGYDWMIPLWDNELMDFFAKVPLEYRLNKVMYDTYVTKEYKNSANEEKIESKEKDVLKHRIKLCIKQLLVSLCLLEFAKQLKYVKNSLMYKNEYYNHPLCWYGIMGLDVFKKNYAGIENINSFVARDQIELL